MTSNFKKNNIYSSHSHRCLPLLNEKTKSIDRELLRSEVKEFF